jgi:tetratricopeptide (TPR) repeat protein
MSKRKTSSSKHVSHVSRTRQGIFFPSLPPLRVLAGVILIAVAVFSAYIPCINGGFVMDDDLLLTNNRLINASDGLQQFWCSTESPEFYPVTNNTFWIEWRLWEINPAGYHVTNLILHIVESLLIWIILCKLSVPGAFLAAVIFAVHPVNVESVAWIASRKNLTAMLFFLLAILWYLKADMPTASVGMAPARSQGGPREREKTEILSPLAPRFSPLFYCLSLAAFVLAMLGKGSTMVLPVLLLGIVWWMRPLKMWDLTRTSPFFVIAALLTAVNMWFQTHGSEVVIRAAGFVERILGAGFVVWFYLYKAILPINLAFIYPQWNIHAANALWWLPLAAALAVTAALWRYGKKWSRPVLFCWGFFCVALMPIMGFTDVGFMRYSLVADRYQHIAIIAVIAPAAAFWSLWHRREGRITRLAAPIIAVTAVGTLALMTWRQSGDFRDEITLYKSTLQKNPQCWLAENNLGKACCDIGQPQEAIEHYRQAIRLKPDYAEAQNNMGLMLYKNGQSQEAIGHYQLAIRSKPDYYEAHNNLGVALAQSGRLDEAIEHFQQALRLKTDYPDAHNNLGALLVKTGRPNEAIEHYEQALRLKPDYIDAHYNLGNVLMAGGQYQQAIEHYRHALAPNPNDIYAYYNSALAHAEMGQSSEAVAAAQKALELARSQGQAAQVKQIEDWLNSYRAGLSVHPNTALPHKSVFPPP